MVALRSLTTRGRQRRTFFAIWVAAVLLMTLTGLHVVNLLEDSRKKEQAAAERDLANLTRVTQEHAYRTLRGADQAIRFITERYLALGNTLDLSALSAAGVIDTDIFNQVGIINEKGLYILANRPVTGRLDLSDREHFRVHVADANRGLFVSKPVLGRATGQWSIQLTRRINRSNGDFAGVVVISIDPGYFTRFYDELKLGAQGVMALYGLDGIARARLVGDKTEVGSNATSSQIFTRMIKGEAHGFYANRSVVDSISRLYHFRVIPGYDLALIAGFTTDEIFAVSARSRQALLLQAGLVILLIFLLAVALTRHLIKLNRATAAREFARAQAQDRTEQLNVIFALSPDGFVSFDSQHRVKYINPAFARMTGLNELRLDGMDETDFSAWLASRCVAGTRFTGISQLRLRNANPKSQVSERLEMRVNGKRVLQVELRLSDTPTVSHILYFRDVTHETEVDDMKSEFLSTAAHELRTPMASILGFSEVLLTQEFDAASTQEFLEIIYTQSKVMANILDELLDLARIEARQGKDFKYSRINVQALVTSITKSLMLPAGRSGTVLSMPDEPIFLMADEGKLRQAILNVLTNAYKYSPAGGPVELTVAPQCLTEEPAAVAIHVSDHGMGMTPEQVAQVFDRFYRADKSGQITGTGLGMSIVKEIIELHHGHITIESNLGQGTCISLSLPQAQPK